MKSIDLILATLGAYQLSEGEILVIASILVFAWRAVDCLAYRTVMKRTQQKCPAPLANTRQSRARIEKNRVAVKIPKVRWQPSKEETEDWLRKQNEGLALTATLFSLHMIAIQNHIAYEEAAQLLTRQEG